MSFLGNVVILYKREFKLWTNCTRSVTEGTTISAYSVNKSEHFKWHLDVLFNWKKSPLVPLNN